MIKLVPHKGLSFDDVLLIPAYSEVRSRSEVDLSTRLGRVELDIPIIASNMDTICGPRMAVAMNELGGIGVVHRNMSLRERFGWIGIAPENKAKYNGGIAFGVNDDVELVIELANHYAPSMLVLDIAHGNSVHALKTLEYVRSHMQNDITIVGGNVATRDGVRRFAEAGADVVKVGIGPGSVCSTRIQTGVGVPQLTAIGDCAQESDLHGVQIIADGGMRTAGDIAKALAAGADAVMLGNMLSGTEETPGETKGGPQGSRYKSYRGMASTAAGSDYPEGISARASVKGPVKGIVDLICKGIASSFSYVGAQNMTEFTEKAIFIESAHSESVVRESKPHGVVTN